MATIGRNTLTLGLGVTSGRDTEYRRSDHFCHRISKSFAPPIAVPPRTDKPSGDERLTAPRKMMNETVYLFALSLPDLLDRIVADREEVRVPVPQPASPDPRG